jgi:hypothetical protein
MFLETSEITTPKVQYMEVILPYNRNYVRLALVRRELESVKKVAY